MNHFFMLQEITVDPDDMVAIERKGNFAYVYLREGPRLQSAIPADIELEDITALWHQAKEAKKKYFTQSIKDQLNEALQAGESVVEMQIAGDEPLN